MSSKKKSSPRKATPPQAAANTGKTVSVQPKPRRGADDGSKPAARRTTRLPRAAITSKQKAKPRPATRRQSVKSAPPARLGPGAPSIRRSRRTPSPTLTNRRADMSQDRYQSLFDGSPIGLYRTTPDGRILEANPALVRMLGCSSFAQLARRNLEKNGFGPQYSRQDFKERMAREGEIRGLEAEWQRRDGSTIRMRENARAVRGRDGRICWYEGTVEDVSSSRKADQALREERGRFWTVLENLPATICLQGPDHRLHFANAAFRERFGNDLERPCYEVQQGRSEPCRPCPTSQVFEEGQAVEREWTDLAGRTYVLHSLPFCDLDGSTLALGIGIDITDRKRAETFLQRQNDLARRLSVVQELQPAMEYVLQAALQVEGADVGAVYAADEAGNLTLVAQAGLSEEFIQRESEYAHDSPHVEFLSGIPQIKAAPPPADCSGDSVRREGIRALISIPVKHEDRLLAAINIGSRSLEQLPPHAPHMLETLSALAGPAIHRIRAEQALREAMLRQVAAVRGGQVGLWDWDLKTDRVHYSAEWKQQIGYEDHEVGDTFDEWRNRVHPDDLESTLRYVKTMIAEARSNYQTEFRFRHRDGSYRWILAQASILADGSGHPVRVLGSHVDVTDRRQADEALRENEERLRLALKATNDVIWDWDVASDSQMWNAAGTTVFGWEDIVASPQNCEWWIQRVHPDDRERVGQGFHSAVQNPSQLHWQDEYRFRRSDGSYALVLDRGYVKRDEQGRAVRMIGAMLDISARKQAEEALRTAYKTANDLVRSIPSGLFIYEHQAPDRLILASANPEAERLTGIRLEEWQGREFNEIWPVAREAGITDHYLEAMRSGVVFEAEDLQYRDDHLAGAFRVRAFRLPEDRLAVAFENITERKRSEDALRRSEATLRGILRAAPVGIGMVTQRVLGWVNSQVEQISGYSMEELRGRSARMLYPNDEEYDRVGALKYAQIRERGIGSVESRWQRKDGAIIEVLLSSSPIVDGAVDGEVAFTVLDITQRKLAEQAVRDKAEELDAFFSSSLDLLAIADTDGHFRRLNREWETTLGYPLHDLEGRRFLDLVHPDDLPATVEAAAVLDKDQRPILNFTNRYRCADGSYRWIEWRSVPKGKLIYAAARDITEQRRTADALREAHARLELRVQERTVELAHANEDLQAEITERRRAEAALRESHSLLESVLRNTSDEIHLKDLEGRYVFVNPAAAEVMQCSAEEIIGRRDSELYPPELAELLICEDRQVIETGKSLSYGRTLSLNDRTRYALTTKVAHRDTSGRVIGVLGIGRDITDYKETQERVARAERLGSIGVLAAGLAHEINNPVGMILLSAENAISLRNESDAPQIMERTLRNIISDAERCSRIVKNLLRFARQERTAKTPGDLNAILERACAAMRNIVRPTGSVIETAFSPNLPYTLVNPIEMSQVFVNLIQNAVSSAERAVRICIKTERTAAGVRAVVEDDGGGLTEEESKHIFDPFYTTKRTRGGMGLGLSIGHGIVTEHGGSIEVHSRLGHGTVVSVELPAVAGEREVEQGHAESAGR